MYVKRILKKLSSLTRKKLRIVGLNIPIVFILIACLSILPIGIAFGEGDSEPTGRNLADQVEIYNIEFNTGAPGGDGTKLPNLTFSDGTTIQNGDFSLSFEWRLIDPAGAVESGDYFDVVLDLGLDSIAAEVTTQVGTFAPIIYLADSTTAGTIKWVNQSNYESQKRIVIRIELDDPGFNGLTGDGTDEGRVAGTGVWGFKYKAGDDAGPGKIVYWQISVGENGEPGGTIPVNPEPSGPDQQQGGNPKYNPYDEYEAGYQKVGGRLTPDSTPVADTIFYWGVQINGHKHNSYEEWLGCPNNHDSNPYNDDPPLPVDEEGNFLDTFTIVDKGRNTAPTWLRNVTEAGGKPYIHTEAALQIDRGAGLYGQYLGETQGPAYLKLFYVNSEYIWTDRIDHENSNYRTPANDHIPGHQPSVGHPVGTYDPYYTTWYLKEGERSSLMYAPNGAEQGGKYNGYLTPVPAKDIVSIKMTDSGFEIEMVTNAVMGKTLAIGYMSKPATDDSGCYNNDVGNSVYIQGVNDGNPLAGASGAVLIGGTIQGSPMVSPNKGSFVIEKYDYNEAKRMPGVIFSVVASSEDNTLEQAANELLAQQKAESDMPGFLVTDDKGKLPLRLPPLPWGGGQTLTLTITETAPEGHFAVKPFTVVIEPENGMVISVVPGEGEGRFVQRALDQYGVYVWNRSTEKDLSVYDAALLKWIKKVDRDIGGGDIVNVYYKNEINEDIVAVKNGDVILFRIDVFNHCYNDLWITDIIDELPAGLVFDKNLTIAHIDPGEAAYNNDMWELVQGVGDKPDMIRYIGPAIYLKAWTGSIGEYPEHRLPLVLKADVHEDIPDGTPLINFAKIEKMLNTNEEDVTDEDPTPENNEDIAIVTPNNEIIISCEVDKDTIRRTSAAYVSPPGREDFDNIADNETYRYDVNFRSTSNISADEFVLDDPLENVNNGQVRLEILVTPVVWGDVDGLYNLWYKTNKTTDGRVYDDASAVDDDIKQRWVNDGYKIWAEGLSATERTKLLVSELGLEADEYVTALRFEFGAVKVGFTSKNNKSVSLNGRHRAPDGSLSMSPEDMNMLDGKQAAKTRTSAAAAPSAQASAEPEGNAFTRFFANIFGYQTASAAEVPAYGIGGPDDDGIGPGDYIDWTPDPASPFFAHGAQNATGLAPISYLVSAAEPMEEERIVASATSMIAKGDLFASDKDAVVTLQLSTFMLNSEDAIDLYQSSFFNDDIPKHEPNTLLSTEIGRTPRTFDEMNPVLWIVTAIAALLGVMLVLRLYNIRKKRILHTNERGGYAK